MLRIKELAEAEGLNITTLAIRAGMAYSQMHGLWTGKTTRPALASLHKVAEALGVPVGALFDDGVCLRLPDELHEQVVTLAKEDRRSLNAELVRLIEEALAARKARAASGVSHL